MPGRHLRSLAQDARRLHRHRRAVAPLASAHARGFAAARRHRASPRSCCRRARQTKDFAHDRPADRGAAGQARRPRQPADRAGRRRGRRPHGLCRQHPAARRRFRPGADDAARPGRQLGRRQDRHQHAATARTWSAPSISRAWCWPISTCSTTLPKREMLAGYAEVVKYGLIDDPEFFAWLRGTAAPRCRGDVEPRRHAIAALRRQGRASSPPTNAKPDRARCSISAIPSATRWRPKAATATNCCTARRSPSAW